jgi:hypothetical protein
MHLNREEPGRHPRGLAQTAIWHHLSRLRIPAEVDPQSASTAQHCEYQLVGQPGAVAGATDHGFCGYSTVRSRRYRPVMDGVAVTRPRAAGVDEIRAVSSPMHANDPYECE